MNSSPKKSEKIIEQIQSILKEETKCQRSPQKRSAIIKPSKLTGAASSDLVNKNSTSNGNHELFKETTNTKSMSALSLTTTRAYPSRTKLVTNVDNNTLQKASYGVIKNVFSLFFKFTFMSIGIFSIYFRKMLF